MSDQNQSLTSTVITPNATLSSILDDKLISKLKIKNELTHSLSNDLHVKIRGEFFVVPYYVVKQSLFLYELMLVNSCQCEVSKKNTSIDVNNKMESMDEMSAKLSNNSDKIIELDILSPKFFKYLIEYLKNEQRPSYFKSYLENEFEEETIKDWFAYLGMEYLMTKIYKKCPHTIKIPLICELTNNDEKNEKNYESRKVITGCCDINSELTQHMIVGKENVKMKPILAFILGDGSYFTNGLKIENTVHIVNAEKKLLNGKNIYQIQEHKYKYSAKYSAKYIIYDSSIIIEYHGLFFIRMEDYLKYDFNDKHLYEHLFKNL